MSDIRLSADARSALRRAITNHPKWDDHRKATGLSLATMSRSDYLTAAGALGIEIQAVVSAADNARAQEAAHAFNGADDSTQSVYEANKREHERAAREMAERDAKSAEFRERMENAKSEKEVTTESMADRTGQRGDQHKADRLFQMLLELTASTVNPEEVRTIVRQEIEASGGHSTVRIEMTANGVKAHEVKGRHHPLFPRLLRALTARDVNGYCQNVWIAGPAGSGKTRAASDAAKALDLAFHFNGAIGMTHELLGFIDAGGKYHRTPFREAYEHGGIFLFDEVDGSDNSALLALNAALANGSATFPDGPVLRHDECRIVASANTWGLGGTAEYVGRAKIDAAFLDRFPVKLDWQYDEKLERDICGNADFAIRVQKARAKCRDMGLKVLITPRASISGAALIAAGFSEDEAAEMTYLANLSPAQRDMLN